MHNLKIHRDRKITYTLKQILLFAALLLIFLPILINRSGLTAIPDSYKILLQEMLVWGMFLLTALILTEWILSQSSPVKWLAVRKKLVLFTRLFVKSVNDGTVYHFVGWEYSFKGGKLIIDLYPNGLVNDTADIGKKLSQYLGKILLKCEESDLKTRYIFGEFPKRYDGIEVMGEGIPYPTGEYVPMISYDPIPVYDNVVWDFKSEALHMLLIAPTGSGKTMFLNYLAGMALKRQHMVYVVDPKKSPFGRLFNHAGVQVARKTDEIIRLLTALVREMEERNDKYFSSEDTDAGADFSTLGLKGHFLFFDEILSVLSAADKKEKAEIVRLLQQLALMGRSAGFSLVITAQKLQADDLPKAITEQCQTRIILGALVSEETFHQATGLYKKNLVSRYKGGVGKGYAITPKTEGLTYIQTPLMPTNSGSYKVLLKELRDRGTPYGEAR